MGTMSLTIPFPFRSQTQTRTQHNTRDHIQPATMSATASSSKVPTVGNDIYEIRQIERKGQGMVAAKDLSPGDVILVEQPMVVINVEGVETTIGAKTVYRQYLGLSKQDRGRFDTLTFHADSHAIAAFAKRCGKEQEKERGRSVARFYTNCMENQASTMRYVAIEAARINHSCSPNTTYEYFDKDNVVAVRALQKIAKGDEILIQYIPPMWSKSKRQAKLWQDWGFICEFQACTSHPYGVVTEKVGDELQHADVCLPHSRRCMLFHGCCR